jgi:kynureninase
MAMAKAKTAARPRDAESEFLELRKEFPILKDTVYLISHSMGAMPRGAYGRLKQYTDEWGRRGIEGYDLWMPRLRETADLVGSIFNAPKGTVAFHQNVSTLVSIALSAIFQPEGRKKIVYTNLNFPSVHYNFAMHRRLGLQVSLVDSPDGVEIPTEKLLHAIDDQTLAVVIDHGIFRSGYLQDVDAIARHAHSRGVYTLVDAYQTVGCVPIDVQAWGIDFLVGGSHKWLCGGPGASFLYVKKDLIPILEPRIVGWFSHARPFGFEMEMEFAPDAMRFATGTPNIPGIHAARAGIEMIAKLGVDRIRTKSIRLTNRLIAMAEAEGLKVRSPRDHRRRSGVVCIDFPGADRAEKELLRKRVHVDYRPDCGLRVSPHFYTREDELMSIVPLLKKFAKRK